MGRDASGAELVARVRKMRDAQNVPESSADLLERVRKFLQEHETTSPTDTTHAVFDSYHDWWVGQKSTYKLMIAEDSTLDLFYRYVAAMYDLGVPLMMAERRSSEIRFVQDLCIWGNKDTWIPAAEILSMNGAVMQLLGRVLGEVFPQSEFLDLFIYDGSGSCLKKGIMKTSVRLVWSALVVDKERALSIHDFVVRRFKDECDPARSPELHALQTRMEEFSSDNTWVNFFSAEVYQGRNFVRMPLCDRVSPQPMQSPENRPFKPVEAVRFNYKSGALDSTEHVASPEDLDSQTWLNVGILRREAGTPLTEWKVPTWNGGTVPRSAPATPAFSQAPATAPGERRSAKVQVRTRTGSDPIAKTARPLRGSGAPAVREESKITAEREFDGTVAEFRARLEESLGAQEEELAQEEDRITWRKEGAQIEFRASNRRVYVQGKVSQVRSMLTGVASFSHSVGDNSRSTIGARTTRTAPSIAGSNSRAAQSISPSCVYAPKNAGAASVAGSAFSTSPAGAATAAAAALVLPLDRKVTKDFAAEGEGEISLTVGDHVTIQSDPEGSTANMHRWVYGQNHSTGEVGWFPLADASGELEEASTLAADGVAA
eukprot:TRINITY_DN10558_c0_g1_i2.p1 TRINITY_DN10558_c0_g1~~TRINITY_DN10558_c0_g1_i2.p1  ORF type:complete len:601 (-),score=138.99 TRINITY_DN10558_c0_g1_i2:77-1879(-)